MSFTSQRGMTLLETMLVLAIAVSVLMMGIRFYNQFSFQANEQKIAANVNLLFQGMESFYHANCRVSLNNNGSPQSSGSLDPLVTDTSGIAPTINLIILSDLVQPGFIPAPQWLPDNPLVDNTQLPDSGYYVQFNRVLVNGSDAPMNVSACTGNNPPPSCNTTSGATLASSSPPAAQSRSVRWVAQVAVKLSPKLTPAQWTQIMNDLGASCISEASGDGVATCDSAPAAKGYLVWIRSPIAYNPNTTSDLWLSQPYVKEFNMQYTNDGMAALSGVKNETTNSATANSWYNTLNYLCGG